MEGIFANPCSLATALPQLLQSVAKRFTAGYQYEDSEAFHPGTLPLILQANERMMLPLLK
jgi:hypothetical protein